MTDRLGVVGQGLDFSESARYNRLTTFEDNENDGIGFGQKLTSFEEAKHSLEEHLKRPLTPEEIERIK